MSDSCKISPEENNTMEKQGNTTEYADSSESISPPSVSVPICSESPHSPSDAKEARDQRTERRDERRLRIEFAAVVVGLIGLGGLFVTFQETQETNRIARRALEAQERPWVIIDKIVMDDPVVFYEDRVVPVSPRVTLKNVGNSVAINVRVKAGVMITSDVKTSQEIEDARDAVCHEIWTNQFPFKTSPLFPNREDSPSFVNFVEGKEVQRKADFLPDRRKAVTIVVYGCVDYQSLLSEDHHGFGFIYNVIPDDGAIKGRFILGNIYSPQQVTFREFSIAKDYVY